MRDSLRTLKQQGLLITTVGRGGGSVVSRPSSEDLISAVDIFARSNGLGPDAPSYRETREIIEPWCAALAASRRTEADLARIDEWHQRTLDAVRDRDEYLLSSQSWHLAVNDASHNPLLASLMHIGKDEHRRAADLRRYASVAARRRAIEVHAAIAREIRLRRPRAALELMAAHCQDSDGTVLDHLEREADQANR